jgi:four helix bundle protein
MEKGQWSMSQAKIERVEQMPVYQLSYDMALKVEKSTRDFTHDFRWLRLQALRSSESVCANMAEGFYSQYSTEYLQSLHRCKREARETTAHIAYARDVGQLSDDVSQSLLLGYDDALRQLGGLIASIERKIAERGKSKFTAAPGGTAVREDGEEYSFDDAPVQPLTLNH